LFHIAFPELHQYDFHMSFILDNQDLKEYSKWLKTKAPRKFAAATGMTLNNQAFGSREQSITIIKNNITVRNERFVFGGIRVKKSHFRQPIETQVAVYGSIRRPRWTGLKEQELGTKTDRRAFTLAGRRGSKGRPAMPSARLKPGKPFISPSDYKGRNGTMRVLMMLAHLRRISYRKAFILRGHRKIKPGLYKLKGGKRGKKMIMLQTFQPRSEQPRRVRWMSGGVRQYFGSFAWRRAWRNALKRAFVR
jgi:hypothetical protein